MSEITLDVIAVMQNSRVFIKCLGKVLPCPFGFRRFVFYCVSLCETPPKLSLGPLPLIWPRVAIAKKTKPPPPLRETKLFISIIYTKLFIHNILGLFVDVFPDLFLSFFVEDFVAH